MTSVSFYYVSIFFCVWTFTMATGWSEMLGGEWTEKNGHSHVLHSHKDGGSLIGSSIRIRLLTVNIVISLLIIASFKTGTLRQEEENKKL